MTLSLQSKSALFLSFRGGSDHDTPGAFGIVTKFSERIFEGSALVINSVGGLILVVSCFIAVINLVSLLFAKIYGVTGQKLLLNNTFDLNLDSIRFSLGQRLLFSLELLVTADVLDTLTKPAHAYQMDSLYKIGMVVLIRTLLSYFLGKEVEELEHKVKHH